MSHHIQCDRCGRTDKTGYEPSRIISAWTLGRYHGPQTETVRIVDLCADCAEDAWRFMIAKIPDAAPGVAARP